MRIVLEQLGFALAFRELRAYRLNRDASSTDDEFSHHHSRVDFDSRGGHASMITALNRIKQSPPTSYRSLQTLLRENFRALNFAASQDTGLPETLLMRSPDQQHRHRAVHRQIAHQFYPVEDRERHVDHDPGRRDDRAREHSECYAQANQKFGTSSHLNEQIVGNREVKPGGKVEWIMSQESRCERRIRE